MFHFNKMGCIPKDEYFKLLNAINYFRNKDIIFPASGGKINDGVDYPDLIILEDIKDIQSNLDTIQEFINDLNSFIERK